MVLRYGVGDMRRGSQSRFAGAWLGWVLALMLLVIGMALPPAQAQIPGFLRPQAQSQPAPEPSSDAISYGALADLLENEAVRKQLIEQLRTLALPAGSAAVQAAKAPQPPVAPEDADKPAYTEVVSGLSARIADEAQQFVEGLAEGATTAVATVRAVASGDTDSVTRLDGWPTALLQMLIVGLATTVAFLTLHVVASRVYSRMDAWVVRHQCRAQAAADEATATRSAADQSPEMQGPQRPEPPPFGLQLALLYGKTAAIVGSLVIDVVVVVLAAAVGYAVAFFGTGLRGDVGPFELMFLNAFVAVEVGRTLVRLVFAVRYENLRLLPMSDELAHYWNRWLERVTFLAGYGVLLVVPVLAAVLSPAVGQMFGLLIMLGVYIYAVRFIWQNRIRISERLLNRARQPSSAFFGTLLRMLARTWHLLAIAYFTVLLVASQVDPAGALPYMTYATLQSVLAIGVGLLLSAVLTALLSRRITLSDEMRAKLPMLEARLNSYVPAILKGIRLFIMVLVALFVLDAWRVFSLSGWLASDVGSAILATTVHVAIILLFAALAWTVVASIIEHRLNLDSETAAPSARERTLLSLFRNATLILIVTMTVLVVLSQIGIDIGPLIAGAGVVGLAIGFGAQKLVQDVINGIFIQLENGMNQNDVVEAAGVFGTVEKISIRSVGIRTLDGGYHMIPFSSVDKVTNHMRDFSYHLGEYTIAYRESVDDAAFHLERAFEELMTDPVLSTSVLDDLTIAGVTSLNERGFTIRILIKTKPGMQWAIQRGYNRLVKKHFNAAGIELPYPHTVVYFGQDKNGFAPPASVQNVEPRVTRKGKEMPAGYTPRTLRATPHDERSSDVLGNEMATVVNEAGEVTTQAGTTAALDAAEERAEENRKPGSAV